MSALQSETIGKIAAALVALQAEILPAAKSAENPHLKSKYADLASIIEAAREQLAKNGLAVLQRAHPCEKGVQLQTTVVHTSGEWISDGGLLVPAQKIDPQGFGSAMTYARRYGYAAMLGIVQDDDDAVAAMQHARSGALTKEQITQLSELSTKAGNSPAVTAARVASMKQDDFEAGIAKLEQRIAEQAGAE